MQQCLGIVLLESIKEGERKLNPPEQGKSLTLALEVMTSGSILSENFQNVLLILVLCPGATPYNGLCGETLLKRGTSVRLQVY